MSAVVLPLATGESEGLASGLRLALGNVGEPVSVKAPVLGVLNDGQGEGLTAEGGP